MSEHPELRKGRRRLFIPFKDNNAGKELSAASISRWICTTIVYCHASIQGNKNIPGKVKAQEVHAVATSLQLFNKLDLQAVMKVGRWSSGGTFTSFYLRDLCPQADSIWKTGPVIAAGEIMKISSWMCLFMSILLALLGSPFSKKRWDVLRTHSDFRQVKSFLYLLEVGLWFPRASPGRRPFLSVKFSSWPVSEAYM